MADTNIDVNVGGLSIKAFHPDSLKKLSESLADPAKFTDFASDPKTFASNHGIHIDQEISDKLKTAVAGKSSLDELSAFGVGPRCTVAAIASPAFALSSTKVAVIV